jgi:hypothetical protein
LRDWSSDVCSSDLGNELAISALSQSCTPEDVRAKVWEVIRGHQGSSGRAYR